MNLFLILKNLKFLDHITIKKLKKKVSGASLCSIMLLNTQMLIALVMESYSLCVTYKNKLVCLMELHRVSPKGHTSN